MRERTYCVCHADATRIHRATLRGPIVNGEWRSELPCDHRNTFNTMMTLKASIYFQRGNLGSLPLPLQPENNSQCLTS
jgi:hypothetical protein